MPFTISDLRQRPEFFDSVAERIWRAWWEPNRHPLEYIPARPQENLNGTLIPLALVAHASNEFLGTASLIASDLPDRPEFTPWVAAVWVEPHARRRGVGAALVSVPRRPVSPRVLPGLSLRASASSGFYESLGWTMIGRMSVRIS